MYKRKHIKKYRYRKMFVLLASLALLLSVAFGESLAFLADSTSNVQNTFTTPKNQININEEFNDGDTVKKNVTFTNESDYPVYLRAAYTANWVDEDNNVLLTVPKLKDDMGSSWIKNNEDGYWYYNTAVSNGSSTSAFIESINAAEPAPEGCHLEVNVIVESVQSEPENAITEAWGVTSSGQEAN